MQTVGHVHTRDGVYEYTAIAVWLTAPLTLTLILTRAVCAHTAIEYFPMVEFVVVTSAVNCNQRNDILCVKCDVKSCSLTHSVM